VAERVKQLVRWAHVVRLLRALALVAAACGGDKLDGDAAVAALTDAPPGACTAPLEDFCDGACPTFATSLDEVQRLANEGRCVLAEQGTCGALRYTMYSSGFFGFTAWFGASGALLAGYRFADTAIYCGGAAYSETYGPIATCDKHVTATYCR